MKILHVIDNLEIGGAQLGLLALVDKFKLKDVSIEVISLRGRGSLAELVEEKGVRVHSLSSSLDTLLIPFRLILKIREIRPDIVHGHLVVTNFLLSLIKYLKKDLKIVSHMHTFYLRQDENRYQNVLERTIYKNSDLIIACGESVATDLLSKRRDVDPKRVIYVYPILRDELEQYNPQCKSAPSFSLLSYGRIENGKNWLYLIYIFKELKSLLPNIRLTLAGNGTQKQIVKDLISELGLSQSIDLIDFQNDVKSLLNNSIAFISTSLNEGLPVSILEAMAQACPVLTTPFVSHSELVKNNYNGLVVPYEDSVLAAKEIYNFLDRSSSLKNMGINARNYFNEKFHSDKQVEKLLFQYDQILHE